jgi:hypothetical protein
VSTNGTVSAGIPIGDSATAMAANTIALKIAPTSAEVVVHRLGASNESGSARSDIDGVLAHILDLKRERVTP